MDDVISEFLVESYENLDRLDQDLIALEEAPGELQRIASIFRTVHTIKGTCGFLGFERLERLTHSGESLLSLLRDGERALDESAATALLRMVDAVRDVLAHIESTGDEGERDFQDLIAILDAIREGEVIEASVEAVEADPAVQAAPAGPSAADSSTETAGETPSHSVAEGSIRVEVGILDNLMNMVGELVLARNQILQHAGHRADSELDGTVQRLNMITTELQEQVMKTRMQPIGNVWSKIPRMVRDLCLDVDKEVRLVMEGKDTELDKTLLEAIKDPLVHIVRNSVDHGVETREARAAAGKPEVGQLTLRAYHEGGQVNLEISDDGAGVRLDRVRAKAIERGVVTPEEAGRLSDKEVMNLVFMPGFSTAEKVTNVSGRGVGMDVVKTNIEKIGGSIDLSTEVGVGTTIKIKIPLTLAIIPALIVTCQGDSYAIPQVNLLELVRLDTRTHPIETIHEVPVYRLRGNLLPLVALDKELGLVEAGSATRAEVVNIVVLSADDRQFGLVVDEINDTEEIVVKPLGKQLKGISAFAGATIMGDGAVALILDVFGLAQKAHVLGEMRDRKRFGQHGEAEGEEQELVSLLVFRLGDSTRMAVPLETVSRLEEFQRGRIERSGLSEVVQYRDSIMPLLDLGGYFGASAAGGATSEEVQAIVAQHDGRSVGLLVSAIEDIVETALD
ncbi:MAG: chemotaxis protein CheA, partial [Planctomycetota bacterium]|nr:chemotaxis protein CheA [Planctomycetota bacterium]